MKKSKKLKEDAAKFEEEDKEKKNLQNPKINLIQYYINWNL